MKVHVIRLEANHMATTFDFRISCPPEQTRLADRVLTHAHGEVDRLESELSEFLEHSPVYRLNHSEVGERVTFTRDAFSLLVRSFELRELTHSAFDPLSKSTDAAALSWDSNTREVWKLTAGTWLGFGAIGKGYALDQVRMKIESLGFQNYLLSAGGSSIVLSGEESAGNAWQWGWSWKKDQDGNSLGIVLKHANAGKVALGVSGTHEKGEHLIDRRRGPTNIRPKSALIGTASAADADALSTALFISGWDQSRTYLDRLPLPPAAAWIDESETPHWNGVFQNLWNRTGALAISAIAFFSFLALHSQQAFCDDVVDLNSLGASAKTFTPYIFDRSPVWILLPTFILFLVVAHLRKTKPLRDRKKLMKRNLTTLSVAALVWIAVNSASAAQIEPVGKAIATLLGTTKAVRKSLNDGKSSVDVFYSKGPDGKPAKAAVVEKGVYQPDCTHTWAIGVDPKTATVTEVRPIEMSCPHAFPTKSASFLDQYKGKGPADVATLDSQVHIIAKATGTSNLATDAVKRAITVIQQNKGKL